MSIGVGVFLMVLGAILAFAVEATAPGINVHTLGIILLLTGSIAVLYSLLFWGDLPLGSAQNRCPPPHGSRGATRPGGRGTTGRGGRGAPPDLHRGRLATVAPPYQLGADAVIGGGRLCKQC
jgi:hypothetical protein